MTGMRINKKPILGIILTCSLFLTNIVSAQTVSNSFSNPSDTTSYNSASVDEKTILENKQKLNEQVKDQTTNYDDRIEENIVSEVIENREEYSKHFKLETGTYIAVSYTEPVNYMKDGKWEEIDNTLIAGTDKELGDIFQNKSNSYKATFSKSISSSRLVTMQKDQYSISWSLNTQKNSGILDTEAEVKNSNIEEKNLTNNEKMMDASKGRSTVIYKSILPDIDLRYTVAPEKIKEDIVINKASSISSFVFDISVPGLKARLNEDNSITFFNPDKPETEIFNIPTPFMIDSSEEQTISDEVKLLLTETKDGYELEITPDAKWINAPERVFPIYIDPTVSSSQVQSDIIDTYVHTGDAAGNHTLSTLLVVGNKTSTNEIRCRSLIKTTIPTLPWGVTVSDARLNLSITSGSSTFQNLDVYKVNASWSSSTMTWNLAESISKTLLQTNLPATSYSNSPSSYRYSCNVTSTAQSIYAGTSTNYGFLVRYTNDTYPDYNRFYSSDYSTSTVRPTLVVTYTYAQTPGITNGATYFIKNKHSGQYLDVAGAGTTNGTNVDQWPLNNATNQRWKAIYQWNGLYKFQAMNTTDKYLEVAYNSNSDGTNINIFSGDYIEQYWSIQNNTNGSYRILSNCSNMTKGAAVENASTSSGANVYQYTYSVGGEDNDDWVFILISGNYLSAEQPLTNADLSNVIFESYTDYNNMPAAEKLSRQNELNLIYGEATAIIIGGMFVGLDMASAMLIHYLGNSGTDFTIPYNRLIQESSYAYNNHINAINNARNIATSFEQQGYSRFCDLAEIPYSGHLINFNWQYSIGQYYMWTLTDILSSYTLRTSFYLRDFYDWNKDDYSLYPLPISQHNLWLLHYAGMAQEYYVSGDITSDIAR